jgi:hypothetical protein
MKAKKKPNGLSVVTAPNEPSHDQPPYVFLAGGIQKCDEWQQYVISRIRRHPVRGTVFNPRRPNFPIGNPDAALEQIRWEHESLWQSDIVSMWFCNSLSDQPICMFEWGVHLTRWQLGDYRPKALLVGVSPGYRREQDVMIQTDLVDPSIKVARSLDEHVANIVSAMRALNEHPDRRYEP